MKSLFLFLCLVNIAAGQVSSGGFYGEVRDESNALVSNAQITISEERTGFERVVNSTNDGTYRVPELAPGIYEISVQRAGFRKSLVAHSSLEVNQSARVDLRLTVGPAQEVVTVNSTLSPIQTDETSEGVRFDLEMLRALPVDERNILSFVTVAPGAVPRQLGGFGHDGDNDVQASDRGSVAFNPPINGARPSANAYLIDGANNTDRTTFSAVVVPPLDSVQEFRVQTLLAGPVFTQSAGGVTDIVTRSGSRDFHGSVFEFLRNEATDAHNYFDDPTLPRPVFRRNQFGGSVGGPLGLKSTFFFASYEGLRSTAATSSRQLVPDAAFRSGNFAGGPTVYDPLSLDASGARLPFAGNIIPVQRIDPIASKYLTQFEPLPNRSGDTSSSNYLDSTPSTRNNDNGSIRIDHQFQRFGQIFGRYTINNEPGDFAGSFPLRPTSEQLRAQQFSLGHTYATSGFANEFRASVTRLALYDAPLSVQGGNVAAELGISNPPTDPFAFGLPYFFLTDFSTVTDSPTLPQLQHDTIWSFSDSVSLVRGKHTWTFGADWSPFQMNYQRSNQIRGEYTYTGAYTADSTGAGGEALADFLLGYPLTTQRAVGAAKAYLRQANYGLFVQHNWHPTHTLSVNLGVRYEYDSPFTEKRGKLLNLDYSTLPQDPRLVSVQTASDPNRTNFSPRAGIAWRLPQWFSHGGEMVSRTGYGIYYNPEIADEAYSLVLNGIQTQINEASGMGMPSLTTRDGFQNSSIAGFPSYYGLDQHAKTPYVQQWNAGFEKSLKGHILLEAAYVAGKGTHLGIFRRFNTPLHTETGEDLSPRPGDLQSLRAFTDLGTLFQRQHIGNSSYQSLQFKAEKRFSGSLTFLTSFVWSKSIDDADSILVGFYESAGAQNENNLRLERGLSFSNTPKRFSAAFVYNLPRVNWLGPVARHWWLNGVITLQDGTPLNPFYTATDFANTGTPNRPNIVPGQSISLPSSERSPDHWFNTAAFSDPAPYTFGNAGRNIIPGPGNEVVDLALARRFLIKDRTSFEIRAQSFNLFNHPNYGIPGPYPDLGPFFGKVFSTGPPRRIEFAARIDF